MASLGDTQNPKELIPGDPDALHKDADKLTKWSGKLEEVGDDLGAVRVPGWTGKASDAFWDTFSVQKKRWFKASDALSASATALRSHADTLAGAQSDAKTAIADYARGAVLDAEMTLASARARVETSGQETAKKLKEQGGSASDAPDWLFWAAQATQTSEGSTKMTLAERERLPPTLKDRYWGNRGAGASRPDGTVTIAGHSGQVKAEVWGAEAKTRGKGLGGEYSAKAGMSTLGAEAKAGWGTNGANLAGQASAKAYLAQASAEGKYQAGLFEASGKAEGMVGADANVRGSVGPDGVHVGGEAFAGAKAGVEGHASVAGVGVGGNAEAWAGIGFEANLDAGMQNGKLVIGGDLGAALGVGAKAGVSVEIDPGKVTDAVSDAADTVGDWGGDAADAIGDLF
ncbi:hypothetical protein E4198_05155 [Streptomyces sp. RKND-216]|uniref:putative T7SS-secreted protein n=1 Tax=Streptomyces sp. RKND-216 TaxID=2562581 RepID=UPI00109DBF10|nr:hypothetical protein [Streptomyces sp. RKND-216]THA24210.1 hypothetical protein E4198_05155 [Streptomyces sp. RKND-216]